MRRKVNLPFAAFAGLWAAGIWYLLLPVGRLGFEPALAPAVGMFAGTAAFAAGLASWLFSRIEGAEAGANIFVASFLTWPIFSAAIGQVLMIGATIRDRSANPSAPAAHVLVAFVGYWFMSFYLSSVIAMPASLFGGAIFIGLRAALKAAWRGLRRLFAADCPFGSI